MPNLLFAIGLVSAQGNLFCVVMCNEYTSRVRPSVCCSGGNFGRDPLAGIRSDAGWTGSSTEWRIVVSGGSSHASREDEAFSSARARRFKRTQHHVKKLFASCDSRDEHPDQPCNGCSEWKRFVLLVAHATSRAFSHSTGCT